MEIDTTIDSLIYDIRRTYNRIDAHIGEEISKDIFDKKFWKRFMGGQKPKDMEQFLKNKIEDPTPLPELTEEQEMIVDMLFRRVKVEQLIAHAGDCEHGLSIINDVISEMYRHVLRNIRYYRIYKIYDDTEIKEHMFYMNRIPGDEPVDASHNIEDFYENILNTYPRYIILNIMDVEKKKIVREKCDKGKLLFPLLNSLDISDRDKITMIKTFNEDIFKEMGIIGDEL